MNPAFAYLYDDFLSEPRFERELGQMETELSRRGIEGRIARLAMFRSAKEMVVDLARAGVKNIVLVGNDHTLQKMMWFLPDVDVTIGYIPMSAPSHIAEMLGIPVGPEAVDVLAARLVEVLDVGKIDERYFLTEVILPATVAELDVEGRYRIGPSQGGAIAIKNLGTATVKGRASADPKDGLLEAIIQTRTESIGLRNFLKKEPLTETVVFLKEGTLISKEPTDVFVDGQVVNGFTFKLSIVPKRFHMITGRARDWTTLASR